MGGLVFSGLAATSFPGWWPRACSRIDPAPHHGDQAAGPFSSARSDREAGWPGSVRVPSSPRRRSARVDGDGERYAGIGASGRADGLTEPGQGSLRSAKKRRSAAAARFGADGCPGDLWLSTAPHLTCRTGNSVTASSPTGPASSGRSAESRSHSDRSRRSSPQATYTRTCRSRVFAGWGLIALITIPLLPYLPAYVRQVDPVFQELVVPSAAVISWIASASAGLTLCPSSLCASATLLARARTKRR